MCRSDAQLREIFKNSKSLSPHNVQRHQWNVQWSLTTVADVINAASIVLRICCLLAAADSLISHFFFYDQIIFHLKEKTVQAA